MLLIDQHGEKLGEYNTKDALRLANEAGLDLVEIMPNANPPVCRIIDYNKHVYEQSKKLKEIKKRQKVSELKEVKFTSAIKDHDYQFKINAIKRFLMEGNRVKCSLRFRGREIVHTELGRKLFERILEDIKEIGKVEDRPKQEGKVLLMMLVAVSNNT